jgi:hypothetical protein
LLNGISVDYAPPPHLRRNVEFPCTLYVNVACQSNNPLALAALLQRGAATLDAEFVDWQLANDNTDAVCEVNTPQPPELTQRSLFVIFPFLSQSLTRLLIFRELRRRLVSLGFFCVCFFLVEKDISFLPQHASIWAHCSRNNISVCTH